MVVGRDGPTGQRATRHVGVVDNPEFVVVTVHHLLIMESLVLDPMRKTVLVMTSPAQVKTCFS